MAVAIFHVELFGELARVDRQRRVLEPLHQLLELFQGDLPYVQDYSHSFTCHAPCLGPKPLIKSPSTLAVSPELMRYLGPSAA